MERRVKLRIASELPVEIEGRWEDDESLLLRLDPAHHWDGFASRATVVRHSSPDGVGTFLAVRF